MIKQITSSEPFIGFVPRAIAADENPSLAGFPANVCYIVLGERCRIREINCIRETALVAFQINVSPRYLKVSALAVRQMIYRPEVKNDYWLRVVLHRSGATGHDFNSAMIQTTMLGRVC
jgi:hypothetical protein